MDTNLKKTYLFITDTDFSSCKLTGAHRRFLELINGVSKNSDIIIVAKKIPQICDLDIKFYEIDRKRNRKLPSHIDGMISIIKKLKEIRSYITYDYAISFGTAMSVCYKLAGYTHVISLFREDLIGYQETIGASKIRILYFRLQELIAVQKSEKIIVQCKNDRESLIRRTKKFCKDIEAKTYIQINNVNTSWMKNTPPIPHLKNDGIIRILFIGDFSTPRKGHEILLPAITKLLEADAKIELYIAGDGIEYEKYVNQYKKYTEIIFLGRIKNIEKYFSFCDFEIVPSLIDSCPNTVLEGLNAGIAVYGANTGGIPDLLIEQKYLFEPTVNAIYNFIYEVLKTQRFHEDAVAQKILKSHLTFDWTREIERCVENL